jgi:hypothetical protein
MAEPGLRRRKTARGNLHQIAGKRLRLAIRDHVRRNDMDRMMEWQGGGMGAMMAGGWLLGLLLLVLAILAIAALIKYLRKK